MGSTGRNLFGKSRTGRVNTETFGIPNSINYKGKIPADSGLEPVGTNKITLKVNADNNSTILFQFKLNKAGDLMTIIGFRNGIPQVKCKVAVDSERPSLDKLIKNGTSSEKTNAIKLKNLFNQSTSVSEYELSAIADKLLQDKKKRGN